MVDDTVDGPEQDDNYHMLLIVVGAHMRAEVADRPLAYGLRQRIHEWFDQRAGEINVAVRCVVCSDIWYVNQPDLARHPTISLGGPGVNALSAYFAQKLARAFVRDNQMIIQLDPEFVDLRVCIWGMNHELTVEALELFNHRYLEGYLRAVVTQVEPQHD